MSKSISDLVRLPYDMLLRERLPRTVMMCNGIQTKRRRMLDLTTSDPKYEEALISAIRQTVQPSDSVVVVGGGWGVSAVAAGRAGSDVTVFEAGDEQIEMTRETVALNSVDNVAIHHAVISEEVEVYGETSADVLPACELPDCDVLEMDCEGAELEILHSLPSDYRPRAIIVETHGIFGSPSEEVISALKDLGYEIVETGVENEDEDVLVLTGVKNE